MKRNYLFLLPIFIFIGFIAYWFSIQNLSLKELEMGKAPSFILKKIDQNGLTNEKFEFIPDGGKIIFIEFIHEWCPHCKRMAPIIENLYNKYSENITFITVAGGYNTNPEKTAEFIKNFNIKRVVVYDPNLEVFRKYGVSGTPTYFIINQTGYIIEKIEGEQSYDLLSRKIERLI